MKRTLDDLEMSYREFLTAGEVTEYLGGQQDNVLQVHEDIPVSCGEGRA